MNNLIKLQGSCINNQLYSVCTAPAYAGDSDGCGECDCRFNECHSSTDGIKPHVSMYFAFNAALVTYPCIKITGVTIINNNK